MTPKYYADIIKQKQDQLARLVVDQNSLADRSRDLEIKIAKVEGAISQIIEMRKIEFKPEEA